MFKYNENSNEYEEFSFDNDDVMPCKFNIVTKAYWRNSNWHKNIELALVFDGEGYVRYDTKDIKIGVGDVVVINPEVVHCFRGDPKISCYVAIVSDRFFKLNEINTVCRFEPIIRDEITREIFYKLSENIRNLINKTGDPLNTAKLKNGLLQLLIDLRERHSIDTSDVSGGNNKTEEKYVKNAMEFIKRNYLKNITLDEISAHVGISKYYLMKKFKNYTGQTIWYYINVMRCRHAERLIAEGNSITVAAFESGFGNLPYFTNTYKRLMGVSPSEFKKKCKL